MKILLCTGLMFIAMCGWSQISVPKEVKTSESIPLSDKQIEEAVKKDEQLQDGVIKGLKTDPQSKTAVSTMEKKSKGSKSNLIKSIFADEKLRKKAIDYVKNDKTLMNRAKKIIGL